jgi:hypothetical protein
MPLKFFSDGTMNASLTVGIVLLLPGAAPAPARGAELQVRGFLDQVSEAKVIPRSQPAGVKPLGATQVPQDVDLVLMAKWSLNYLAGTITVDRDFESSYGNWPLKYPPFSMAGDNIAGGDTECRNDLAFVLMREMSGIDAGLDIQKGVRQRLLKRYHAGGLFLPVNGDTDVIWATTWLAPPPSIEWEGKPIKITYRAELDFCVLEPYVRFFEVTGDAGMLAVAKGLADGRLDGLAKGHDTSHMHSMMHGVEPLAHLGAVTGEARYLDWAEARLKETEPFRTDYGWVAAVRDAGFSSPKISETCALADVMQTAIFLARGGRTAYWDFVERAMRNYLPQEQFFIDETFKTLWAQANSTNPEALVKGLGLVRRMEGGFFCRTDPEDRWSIGTLSLEGCCPPTGMTGLHLGWKSIVTKTPAGVFINLALNTDTPAARVVSFLPDQGRVTVVAKEAATYNLRVPGFAPRERAEAWRGGKKVRLAWNGDYVHFASVQPGEELTVTYPLVGFVQKMKRGGTDYTIQWKGNEVASVSPKGRVWPLFEKVPFPTPPYPGQLGPVQKQSRN